MKQTSINYLPDRIRSTLRSPALGAIVLINFMLIKDKSKGALIEFEFYDTLSGCWELNQPCFDWGRNLIETDAPVNKSVN